ncbi:MAG: DNA polymerase III subunit gamma/tau, partial [Spirochaetia bacterium]|nr:DNA polymerase III subunit gamma/tau [Spirochaetia bacterium]
IEEPPSYVLFIFATTETHKVPATIRSRCQQFHFQLIPLETIKEVLKKNVLEIGVKAEDEALFWIAKESTGSMRDAYTLFDQILSFSDGHITLDGILQKLGIAGVDSINTLLTHVIKEDSRQAMEMVDEILTSGVSVEQCIKDIASYLRVVLLMKRNIENESILGMQKSSISEEVISTFNEEQLEAALHLFLQLYKDVRYSLSPRFELELSISRLITLKRMFSSSQLVKQIQEMKLSLTNNTTIPTTVKKATPPVVTAKVEAPKEEEKVVEIPIPVKVKVEEKRIETKEITLQVIREMSQVLAEQRDSVGMLLHQVVSIDFTPTLLTIIFSSEYVVSQTKEHMSRLGEIFLQHTGFSGKIVCEVEKKVVETITSTTDEVVKRIATLFRGEILTN